MNHGSKPKYRYPLDNASQIFVNILSKGETTFSRIAFTLSEDIHRERLQSSINKVLVQRFPYYQVYLRKALFGYVLEKTDDLPRVEVDRKYCCRYVNLHQDKFLFRFLVMKRKVALEMSHIITDGYGLLVFLATVLAEYLRASGLKVEKHPLIFDLNAKIDPREWQCGYRRIFDGKGPPQKIDKPAYIPHGKAISFDKYYTTHLRMNLDTVKQKAREISSNLLSFAYGIYMWAIQELYLDDLRMKKTHWNIPLRMQIPVNLRNLYETPCMKNFCYVYSPSFTIKRHDKIRSCEEIIHFISDSIRHEKENNIVENQIQRNIRGSSAFWFRYMHRKLKEYTLSLFYQIYARGIFSGVLTNLGEINLPPSFEKMIDSMEVVPCNSPAPGRNSAMFSYKGILEICIASTIEDIRMEKKIAEKLDSMGVPFSRTTNRESSPTTL